MSRNDKWRPELWSPTRFQDMPEIKYDGGQAACPECFAPISRKRKDGRCDTCLHDRDILPVNHVRRPKRKTDDEDEYEIA